MWLWLSGKVSACLTLVGGPWLFSDSAILPPSISFSFPHLALFPYSSAIGPEQFFIH